MSQHTPPVDSSPINRCSTQHGHDLDDAEVSGFPRKEASDPDVSSMPSQNNLLPSVNDDRSAPPSVQVNQHVNAGSPPRKPVNIAPRVAFAESSETILEAFPNGIYFSNCPRRGPCANHRNLQRSSPTYCRTYLLSPCLRSLWCRVDSMR